MRTGLQAQIWAAWGQGLSMATSARILPTRRISVYNVIGAQGDNEPPPRRRANRALSVLEREWIGKGLAAGCSLRMIARHLKRAPSKSRFLMLVKVGSKNAPEVAEALGQHVRELPVELRRSLTWDRGTEMARHKDFTLATDMQVYFCDPHSPWQRGTNENTNGLLRQYLPKGEDLSDYSQERLNEIAMRLNQRPRQTLGFSTPAAVLSSSVALTG
jgi:IS30 family transposase